jgi:hypothetical protein
MWPGLPYLPFKNGEDNWLLFMENAPVNGRFFHMFSLFCLAMDGSPQYSRRNVEYAWPPSQDK